MEQDAAYIMERILAEQAASRPHSMNRVQGVSDDNSMSWNGKETADPTAGTGPGTVYQSKADEVI